MATKFVLRQEAGKRSKGAPSSAEYTFDGGIFTLGSDATNNLVLDKAAAPEQAVIVREGDRLTLINSADGTALNGQNLRREAINPLVDGDEIRIGKYTISVIDEVVDADQPTAAVAAKPERYVPDENGAPQTTAKDAGAPFSAAAAASTAAANEFSPLVERRAPPKPSAPDEKKSPGNFAAVLDTLRTEEDSFYFIVKNRENETGQRVALEQTEIPLGANEQGEIVFDIKQMTTVFGVARKDWSGIQLEANRRDTVFVNGEAVETSRRLRNDDVVSFAAPVEFSLVLHEPSLLVALEPLLSARTVSSPAAGGNGGGGAGESSAASSALAVNQTPAAAAAVAKGRAAKPSVPLLKRIFFKYFSFVEVLTMIIGTLIGAVVFFLVFEFMFS